MEDWLHLLPDALDCISLLQNSYSYEQLTLDMKKEFPHAKDLLVMYLQEEIYYLDFQSSLGRKRRKMLAAQSDSPGKIFLYKLNNLEEPWEFPESEVSLLINALEDQNSANVTSLLSFLREAENNGGFNTFVQD